MELDKLMNREYSHFLKKIADFGHGVFTLTMLKNQNERNALKKWLQRHPSFTSSFTTIRGTTKIYVLSKKAMKFLDAQDSLSQGAVWSTYMDMALLNAYMVETASFTNYINRPHITLDYCDKKIGLISYSWSGPTNPLTNITQLVTVRPLQRYYLKELDPEKETHFGIETPKAINLIKNAFIPRAFYNYRPS